MSRHFSKQISRLAMLGLAATLHTNSATAKDVCAVDPFYDEIICKWTSPWGNNDAIELVIGQDLFTGKGRWVAKRRDAKPDPKTGLIETETGLMKDYFYKFMGTKGDDRMIEIPSGLGPLTRGGRQLSASPYHPPGLEFYPGSGSNIIIAGDHTSNVSVQGGGSGTNILLMFPNAPWHADGKFWGPNRALYAFHSSNMLILGPSIAPDNTRTDVVSLNAGTNVNNEDFVCNLASTPVDAMNASAGTLDRKFGLANFVTPGMVDDGNAGQACFLGMLVAVSAFYN